MINIYESFLIPSLFKNNFLFLCSGVFTSIILYYFTKFFNFQYLYKNYSVSGFTKLILATTLAASFFIHCLTFWIYSTIFVNHNNAFLYSIEILNQPQLFFFKLVNFSFFGFKFSIEFFGFIFIILAYLVGLISFLCLDAQFY
jgi:hypothetical protein